MGFEDVNSGEGFTKFGKGANLLIKADSIDHSQGSYQGDEYQQLDLVFEAVPENGGDPGVSQRGRPRRSRSGKATSTRRSSHSC